MKRIETRTVLSGLALLALVLGGCALHGSEPKTSDQAAETRKGGPAVDLYGDPLPAGAVARLGRSRFWSELSAYCLAFSPDGNLLASGHYAHVTVWDARTGKVKYKILGETNVCVSVAFSPDGKYLSCGGLAHEMALWDANTGMEVHVRGPNDFVSAVAFSPDGKTLANCNTNRIKFWDVESGRLRSTSKNDLFTWKMAYTPDGTALVMGDIRNGVYVWDIATEKPRVNFPNQDDQMFSLSPDGKMLATCRSFSEEGPDLTLWQMPEGKTLLKVPGEYSPYGFSPDGKVLAVDSREGIHLWEMPSGKAIRVLTCQVGSPLAVAFSPDGRTLAAGRGGDRACLNLWDWTTGREISDTVGHARSIRQLVFLPGDGELVTSSGEDALRFWDPATGRETRGVELKAGGLNCLDLSPDGKQLAVSCHDNVVCLLEMPSGAMLRKLEGHTGPVWQAFFSPDGRFLVSQEDLAVRYWNVAEGREIFRVEAELMPVSKATDPGQKIYPKFMAFSPDGKKLFTRHDGKTIRCWDTATGKELDNQEEEYFLRKARSPDGHLMAQRDEEGQLNLIEEATGHPVLSYKAPKGGGWRFAISFNQRFLATDGKEGTGLVWDLTLGMTPKELGKTDLESFWADLAGADAAKAYRDAWMLVFAPAQALPFLQERLGAASADPETVRRLIKDLGNGAFDARDKAEQALLAIGPAAEPLLDKALENQPDAEVLARANKILSALRQRVRVPAGEALRRHRAIRILELIGGAAARTMLETMARESPSLRERERARASIARLGGMIR